MVQADYGFHSAETITSLYPNADHYYNVTFTTVNPLVTTSGAARININIDNVFTLSSTHCEVVSSAASFDGRGIICELTAGGTVVDVKNLGDVSAGTVFSVFLQMVST